MIHGHLEVQFHDESCHCVHNVKLSVTSESLYVKYALKQCRLWHVWRM